MIPFLLFLIGIWFRVTWFGQMYGGELLMDELSVSRLLPGSLLVGEAPYNGATNLAASALWLVWERLLGLSPHAVRSLSALCGLASLFYFYRLVKERDSRTTAVWATALFAVSFNASYFSSLAMETHFPLLWGPVLALGLLRWREAPTVARSLGLGLAFAVSLYTYPGQLLGVLAYFPTVAWLCWRQRRWPALTAPQRKGAAIGLGVVFLVFVGVYWIHLRLAVESEPLWLQTTERLPHTSLQYVRGVVVLIAHSVLGGKTGVGGFPMPMFEVLLWPFFLAGAMSFWRRKQSPWLRALPLCLVTGILIAALAARGPSARRLIFYLPVFYYSSAVGIQEAMARFKKPWLGAGIAGALAATVLVYHHSLGGKAQRYRLEPYWTQEQENEHYPPPEAVVMASLARGDLTIGGPTRPLESQYLLRLKRLGEFVGTLPPGRQIHFSDAPMPDTGCSPIPPKGRQLFWCGPGLIYRRESIDHPSGRKFRGRPRHLYVQGHGDSDQG